MIESPSERELAEALARSEEQLRDREGGGGEEDGETDTTLETVSFD